MQAARWARLVGIAVLVLALYFAIPIEPDPRGGPVLRVVIAVLVFAGLAAAVLGQVRLSLADENRRLDGLVVAILCVWIVFSLAFYALAVHEEGQVDGLRTRVDSLYFTASTMLTVGFGDVHATGQLARVLVLLQLLFDVVFVATAASTLSAHVRRKVNERQGRDTQRNPR
jgi:hypothetical protein